MRLISVLLVSMCCLMGCSSEDPFGSQGQSTDTSQGQVAGEKAAPGTKGDRLNTLAVYPTRNLSDMRISSVASFSELESQIRKLNWDEPNNFPEVIFSHDPKTTNEESIAAHGSLASASGDGQLEIEVTVIDADDTNHRFSSTGAKSVDDIVSVFKAYYEKTDDWREQLQWSEH